MEDRADGHMILYLAQAEEANSAAGSRITTRRLFGEDFTKPL